MQLDPNMIEALLANASVYDLYCINKRISLLLDDESRIQQIKQSLQAGQLITYFNSKLHNLISATIIEKQIKRVLVEHTSDHTRWWTHYYAINLNDTHLVPPIVKQQCGVLSKGNMSIGDTVGFEHKGDRIIGTVIKLNPKTVELITSSAQRWNVYYKSLFAVIDAELNIIDIPMISNSGR